jgi:hypothetical protein
VDEGRPRGPREGLVGDDAHGAEVAQGVEYKEQMRPRR